MAKLLVGLMREQAHPEDVFSKVLENFTSRNFELQNQTENLFQKPILNPSSIYN